MKNFCHTDVLQSRFFSCRDWKVKSEQTSLDLKSIFYGSKRARMQNINEKSHPSRGFPHPDMFPDTKYCVCYAATGLHIPQVGTLDWLTYTRHEDVGRRRTFLTDEARRLERSVNQCGPVVWNVSPAVVVADDVVLNVSVNSVHIRPWRRLLCTIISVGLRCYSLQEQFYFLNVIILIL